MDFLCERLQLMTGALQCSMIFVDISTLVFTIAIILVRFPQTNITLSNLPKIAGFCEGH